MSDRQATAGRAARWRRRQQRWRHQPWPCYQAWRRRRLASGERDKRGEGGQATVEAAIVLPFFVLMMLAVIQVGVVAYSQLLLVHATREAGREAAVNPDAASALSAAQSASGLQSDRLNLNLTGGRRIGDRLTVRVTYRAPTSVPLVGWMVSDIDLEAEMTVRVE